MADQDYQRQLGEVLRQRDPAALRRFLEANAARYGDERQVEAIRQKSEGELLELMHRMILARSDLAELHAESRRWLHARQARRAPHPRLDGKGDDHRG